MTVVRRVVTGHDQTGRSCVQSDEEMSYEIDGIVWSTGESPADNMDQVDGAKREGIRITSPGGSLVRILDLPPGRAQSPMHRTKTIDYAIILEGQLQLVLDGGETVDLSSGDVVVQRGTAHAWKVLGDAPCKVAIVLIDSQPVVVGGEQLGDVLS